MRFNQKFHTSLDHTDLFLQMHGETIGKKSELWKMLCKVSDQAVVENKFKAELNKVLQVVCVNFIKQSFKDITRHKLKAFILWFHLINYMLYMYHFIYCT